MPNAWDGLSVRIFGHAGFQATATSSAAYAFALGRVDGRHQVTREEHLAHARFLTEVGELPVNVLIGPAEGGVDLKRLFDAGVKRISLGSTPYLMALNAMVELSQTINGGDVAAAQNGLPFRAALKFITEPLPKG